VVRIDARTGRARGAGSLGEPLSDLGAVSVARRIYLVGGYTGSRYATAVLRFRPGRAAGLVTRLPAGLRYAGVAALDGKIYVAGGVTPAGESDSVFVVDPARGTVRRLGTLPAPVAHAPLVALGGKLYLVGGTTSGGAPVARIVRIDPWSGSTTVAGRLPHPLADSAAVRVGSRAIVLGGTSPTPSSAVLALS
jgi:N-acetylneuraminic acid mutarotase